jgi:hypothetical protein
MRVRLIKKLAAVIDGIDVSAHTPGDLLDLKATEARLLIAEGWAVSENRRKFVTAVSCSNADSAASDAPARLIKARPGHTGGRLSLRQGRRSARNGGA